MSRLVDSLPLDTSHFDAHDEESEIIHAADVNAMAMATNALIGAFAMPSSYGAVGIGAGDDTGTIASGSHALTITSHGGVHDFEQGQAVLVRGGASGTYGDATADEDNPIADLCTTVQSVSGSVLTLVAAAGHSVTDAKVYHHDGPAIQECLDNNKYVFLAPINGGYGVSAQWQIVNSNRVGLSMSTNTTMKGCGQGGKLVRIDTYRWGDTATYRFISEYGATSPDNLGIESVFIDGNLAEVEANWPSGTLTSQWDIGETTVDIDDASDFPSAGSVAVQRKDGTWAHSAYTGKTGNQLTGVKGFGHDTSNTAPIGSVIEPDVGSQQYQMILMDGSRTDKIYGLWIDHLYVDGWPGTTMRPKNVERFRVADCILRNVNRGPLEITDSCAWGMVSNNIVDGAYDDGLDVNGNIATENNGEEAHHISIVGNQVRQQDETYHGRIGNTGIKVSGLQHGRISDNTVWGGENTAGILLWDSDSGGANNAFAGLYDIVCDNNEVHDSSVHGIRVRSFEGKNLRITNNLVVNSKFCGIMIEPKTPDETPGVIYDLLIQGNHLIDCGTDERRVSSDPSGNPPGISGFADSDSTTGIFKNAIRLDGTGCTIVRCDIIDNIIVRPRAEAFVSKVNGTDFHLERNKVYNPNWLGVSGTNVFHMPSGTVTRFTLVDNLMTWSVGTVNVHTKIAGDGTHNEVQQINPPALMPSDTATITANGQTTASFTPYSETAAALQTILRTALGGANCTVTGPTGGPWDVTFIGSLANTDIADMTMAITRTASKPKYMYQLRGTSPNIWTEGLHRGTWCYTAHLDTGGVVLHDQASGTLSVPAGSDMGLHKAS